MFVLSKPPVLDQHLLEAKKYFSTFLRNPDASEKVLHWQDVIRHVGDAPVSKWMELCVHVFYEHVFTHNKVHAEHFLTFMGSLHLNKITRDVSKRFQFIFESIKINDARQVKLMKTSCFDFSRLDSQIQALQDQTKEMSEIMEFSLAQYLIIVQGVLFLEQRGLIAPENEILIKERIKANPKEWFRTLMPIFVKLTYADISDDSEFMVVCQDVFKELLMIFQVPTEETAIEEDMFGALLAGEYLTLEGHISACRV